MGNLFCCHKARPHCLTFSLAGFLKPVSRFWHLSLNFALGVLLQLNYHSIGTRKQEDTLLEKQSKVPRYNMKCRGKPDTTWNIPRSITFSPLHFMLYRRKFITFWTVHIVADWEWERKQVTLSQRKSTFRNITWNVAGKRDTTLNISCIIMFSSTFHVISWKFGLLF